MPSQPVPKGAYKNLGDFQFSDQSKEWGLDQPSFSNGSAYGDLDNDGDLDLVVNNVNMPAFIYENKVDTSTQKSITIKLKGSLKNTNAIGTKVEIYYAESKYDVLENFPSRGFESSVSNDLLFGIGNTDTVDSLIISWPMGSKEIIKNLKANTSYEFKEPTEAKENELVNNTELNINPLVLTNNLFDFNHRENNFIDFNREQLLPEMYNNEGPNITSADINNDGNPDFYIGGAKGQTGKLFISQPNKTYKEISEPFEIDSKSEDTDAVFFDSDNDGDLDLYVCSGGKSFSKFDFSLNDRL